ncbi:hypothetical protein BOTBODRAFT_189931 [Botryobasidium botryosum FD-172 SS1]|uniref:Uncharacterized protein n=1 Tax=Botryobasidium botryosum (strain FD-172 SS1) TaxID=930990 RepID=A0A067MHY0_BOTB1|nr:hypothetical protein BOTBODRAFT_189931 [Botryobasidium botryosum FD-172 SS1]
MTRCPFSFPSFKSKDDKDASSSSNDCKKSSRSFPWIAFGGLTLVVLLGLTTLWFAITSALRFSSIFFFILSLPFRGLASVLGVLVWVPLKFVFSIVGSSSNYTPAFIDSLHCNNSMELQGWEVLNFVPASDGNPKPIQYQLNSPTPHAVSFIDIDYRDTRLDVFANGDYYGSTSDFVMDKSVYCGEDLNACIEQGFSMGTVIIPAGKKTVEITWSGKDVFPGTDKIVWGSDRRRRVMWKKELCL